MKKGFRLSGKKAWQAVEDFLDYENSTGHEVFWDLPTVLTSCYQAPSEEVVSRIKAALSRRGYSGSWEYFKETHSLEHIISVLKDADV